MTRLRRSIGVLTLALAAATPAFAQEHSPAGRIKVVSGSAFIVRGTKPSRQGPRSGLRGRWFANGRRWQRRRDTQGRHPALTRIEQRSAPRSLRLCAGRRQHRDGAEVRAGVAAYVSGRMAKLAPDAIRLETPAAIVGIRGTTLALHVQP